MKFKEQKAEPGDAVSHKAIRGLFGSKRSFVDLPTMYGAGSSLKTCMDPCRHDSTSTASPLAGIAHI